MTLDIPGLVKEAQFDPLRTIGGGEEIHSAFQRGVMDPLQIELDQGACGTERYLNHPKAVQREAPKGRFRHAPRIGIVRTVEPPKIPRAFVVHPPVAKFRI